MTAATAPAPRTATPATTCQENRMSVGATVWLTGLPSAGKTTIALALAGRLRGQGRRVEVLDGDEMREFLSAGLGFSREDRHTNVRRIGFVAELLASHGVLVLVPVIAPYTDSREAVRKRHQARGTGYLEVHVATPLDVCSARDVKGLYAKQAAGELAGLTGVDDPYEVPVDPDLRIGTRAGTVRESAAAVHALLAERGLTGHGHRPAAAAGDAPARGAGEREEGRGI
jgi:adenylylsulfate kinase